MFSLIQKGVILFCCAVLAFCLSGCKTASPSETDSKPEKKIELPTPEKAAELYLQNLDLWMESPETATAYGYSLLDLDFDGGPELVASVCSGTGMYSSNKFYTVDPENMTVEPIETAPTRGEDPDYFYLNERSKLLKNKESGKLFYLVEDYVRVSEREGAEAFYEVYLQDGKLRQEPVFSESFSPDYEGGTNTSVRVFTFRGETLTKSEYDKKLQTYYEENIDQNGKWHAIPGEDFAAGDDSAKLTLLLDACRGFSYGIPSEAPESDPSSAEPAEPAEPSKTN